MPQNAVLTFPILIVRYNKDCESQLRTLVKSAYQKIIFLFLQPKHMLWVLKYNKDWESQLYILRQYNVYPNGWRSSSVLQVNSNGSLHAGLNFSCSFCRLLTFFQNKLFQKNLSPASGHYYIRVSSSLDPDQNRHSVVPDLGPVCLQKISANDKSCHKQERVMKVSYFLFSVSPNQIVRLYSRFTSLDKNNNGFLR